MKTMHLDDEILRKLMSGQLSPALASALARHLEGPCDACEQYLAGLRRADIADGLADEILVGVASGGEGAGNDVEFARIERRLSRARVTARSGRRRLVPRFAVAAALLCAGLAALLFAETRKPDRPVWDGSKGPAAAGEVSVRLRFVVVRGTGAGATLQKGVSGQTVTAGSGLQLEIELARDADVALVRVGSHGPPEIFFHERLGAGVNRVLVEGRPAVYPLADLSGAQRFVAIASEAPLGAERLEMASRQLTARAAPLLAQDGFSTDAFEIIVR